MKELIEKFGKNHTDPAVVIFGDKYVDAYGIYTFKGEVFCINEGMDFPFEDLEKEKQTKIISAIKENKFEINPAFQ